MAKTPLQVLIEEFTDIKYTLIINRAKELLAVEEKELCDAYDDGGMYIEPDPAKDWFNKKYQKT